MSLSRDALRTVPLCLLLAAIAGPAGARSEVRLLVRGGETDLTEVPVSAEVKLPGSFSYVPAEEMDVSLSGTGAGKAVPGQVVKGPDGATRLWWVIPSVRASSSTTWTARFSRRTRPDAGGYSWKDEKGKHLDLLLGDTGVTRYMYERDRSTSARAHETYKCYHHVYDVRGQGFITKGPHGLYTHHRGIYIGWSKVAFEGKRYDLWHMKPSAVQLHKEFPTKTAGPVLALSVARIDWKTGDEKDTILVEERSTTVYRLSKPTLVLMDFVSAVKATADVDLSGDPEHAGFQFRPSNAISGKDAKGKGKAALGENRKATYLFHAEGVNPKKQKDLPWVAMSYALGGQPYSVVHMSHADNTKGAVWSAYRDYGRFGCWTRKKLQEGETLTLRYRLWIGASEMPSREECAARREAFVNPPKVTVVR